MSVLYNPDLLPDETLRRLFVVRDTVLAELVAGLREPSPTHPLVVGPRGMGKTTLLRRLHLALREDPELRQRWVPLAFPEEQYNVTRLDDFWSNCVDALADTLERLGRAPEARALDAAIDDGARPFDTLLEFCGKEGRGLVLLVDNLDLVLARLDEQDQWMLRRVLGGERRLVLVGASANLADETAEYGKPFYEFLHPLSLAALTLDETRRVLAALAHEVGGDVEVALPKVPEGRLRSLHALTGGNPRTIVLIFEVLLQDLRADAETVLNGLLDRVTPLYKARFEALPAQLQAVLDAVALHWDPVSAAGVAEHSGLGINLVSAQLARLVELGHVEKTALPGTRKAGFQVAERFFNIWYLMRASRRLRRRLGHLVRFMELYWMPEERRTLAASFLVHPADLGTVLALIQTREVADDAEARAALLRSLREADGTAEELRKKLAEMVEPGDAGRFVRDSIDLETWRREVRETMARRADELAAAGMRVEDAIGVVMAARCLTGEDRFHTATTAELWAARGVVAAIAENVCEGFGRSVGDAWFGALLRGAYRAPEDLDGMIAAAIEQRNPWIAVLGTFSEVSPERARRLPAAIMEAAEAEAFRVRDWRVAAKVGSLRLARGESVGALAPLTVELGGSGDPADVALAYADAGYAADALRVVRSAIDAGTDDVQLWRLLARLAPAELPATLAVGLARWPDDPDLLGLAWVASSLVGRDDATDFEERVLSTTEPEGQGYRLLAACAVPKERAVNLVERELKRGIAPERQELAVLVLSFHGQSVDSVLKRCLRGLRGRQRAERTSLLEGAARHGRQLAAVDTDPEWRRGYLDGSVPWIPGGFPDQLLLLAAGGHGQVALDWMEKRGLTDRLAPFELAIRIDLAADRDLLLGLAPEIRTPTADVLVRIALLRTLGHLP